MVDNLALHLEKFKMEYQLKQHPKSLQDIQYAVNQLMDYCEEPIRDVKAKTIRKWLLHLDETGYAPVTIRKKLYRIKPFFQYCLEEKIIDRDPLESIVIPEAIPKPPYYLEFNQVEKLRLLVAGELRQRATIEVLYTTGVRLGELITIKKEDIQWSERMIHIRQGKGKKARIVLFTPACGEHVQVYLQERRDDLPFLFVNRYKKGPLSPSTVDYWFENYRMKLGFHVTPHTLRHTFAAHLAKKGMSLECIQVLLGHDEPRHTQLYTRLFDQARKNLYDEWM